MPPLKKFPCLLLICLALGSFATAAAQTANSNLRQVHAILDAGGAITLETEPLVVPTVHIEERASIKPLNFPASSVGMFEQILSGAIEQRLGARYVWGATGPNVFDCSGFVWSSFQTAGIKFSRASARSLWSTFAPATRAEESQLGTLVFFSGKRHIGIVADKNGFYHASRHHGVVYSPFNDYWLKRIDGFRRVPVNSLTPQPVE
ncbi:MAG: C40 family peptidase [Pyrinomonadaceae bacterium]